MFNSTRVLELVTYVTFNFEPPQKKNKSNLHHTSSIAYTVETMIKCFDSVINIICLKL